ncbi:response regulator transcription factor [Kordiimonas sp. SCSIO 12603]|uniref:LytR/AlgR family response regulator transcription factor n=1 Tax=Kordiimonas sp. SCSIO 12603 TaxID=2829596 RepID=UPI0021030545|nr:LytTR family DNA-binding domain-containing protein [Kordiimonas sp. SCSIO 12603]UTW60245.1 response regulator transcription factor [Kordiimonas sp. SCSIO 12603]
MIKALIIDDEPLAHEIIKTYLNEVDDVEISGHCHSAQNALEFLKTEQVDLIFLDIEMPVLSGLDFLSMLKEKPAIIITSAYEEYALESYNFDVTDYLLKPYRFDRFEQALEKVRHRISNASQPPAAPEEAAPIQDSLLIKVDSKHIHVRFEDIHHLEAYGNYVKVWRGDNYLLTPASLISFEKSLPSNRFIRIHKSFIARKDAIDFIEDDTVVFKTGLRLPIGKTHRKNLLNW